MAHKKWLGNIGEAKILAEAIQRGYQVAIPYGEDWRFDLIVFRKKKLERVQCKYTKSHGDIITVRCRSLNNWNTIRYTEQDVDWIAVYDETTDECYFIPSSVLGRSGRATINLRISPTKNKQSKGVLWAKDYLKW